LNKRVSGAVTGAGRSCSHWLYCVVSGLIVVVGDEAGVVVVVVVEVVAAAVEGHADEVAGLNAY
jgi:hypothetical protein